MRIDILFKDPAAITSFMQIISVTAWLQLLDDI